MKVGIITFHYSCNFGAVLQCASLSLAIEMLGHHSKVVNFVPGANSRKTLFLRGWGLGTGELPQALRSKWIELKHGGRQRTSFNNFRAENLRLHPSSPLCDGSDVPAFCNDLDVLVSGSDQVWNFRRSDVYFLKWTPDYPGTRIAYAACCTTREQPDNRIDTVGASIRRFQSVSVRDEDSRHAVRNASGVDPVLVADPTLLVEPETFCDNTAPLQGDYILLYVLGDMPDDGRLESLIDSMRQRCGSLPVVCVTTESHRRSLTAGVNRYIHDAGPKQWLDLLKFSSGVITDSYHAALFSLRFFRPLAAFFVESQRAPRLLDLASRYDATECVVNLTTARPKLSKSYVAGPTCQQLMLEHAEKSIEFLSGSLAMASPTSVSPSETGTYP